MARPISHARPIQRSSGASKSWAISTRIMRFPELPASQCVGCNLFMAAIPEGRTTERLSIKTCQQCHDFGTIDKTGVKVEVKTFKTTRNERQERLIDVVNRDN